MKPISLLHLSSYPTEIAALLMRRMRASFSCSHDFLLQVYMKRYSSAYHGNTIHWKKTVLSDSRTRVLYDP